MNLEARNPGMNQEGRKKGNSFEALYFCPAFLFS